MYNKIIENIVHHDISLQVFFSQCFLMLSTVT